MSEQVNNTSAEAEDMVDKIKELVKKGNISRIYVKKNDEVIINLPLNVGLIGGIIGAVTAPWIMIGAAITTIGLDCTVELQKSDGTIVDISGKTIGRKAVDMGSVIAEEIQDTVGGLAGDEGNTEE